MTANTNQTTTTARATWHDGCGNTMRLTVRDGKVSLTNQHGIRLSLSTVMFLTSHNGYAARDKALREAVKGCATSAELARKAQAATRINGWIAA